jgi:drug/metabolite transporter (DMT)-like permease
MEPVGYLYAILASLLFGANGSLTKLLIEGGLTPAQITQFRTFGALVLSAAVLALTDRPGFRIPLRQIPLMAVLGIVGIALIQVFYASAIERLPVGITLLIEYTAVLLVALIAFLVFRETVKARLWVAIVCVLAGLAIVAQVWDSRLDTLGVLFAAGAALALTLYFLVGERQVTATSPLTVAFWTMLFASAVWAPFSRWWEISPTAWTGALPVGGAHGDVSAPLWLAVVVTVVLGSFIPYFLSFAALKRLSATTVGIVASAEVIFAFLVAWLWLSESLDPTQIAGASAVLLGIVLAQTARSGKIVDAELDLPPPPDASVNVGGQT